MKRIRKISMVWSLFLIQLVSMAFIVITGETVIRANTPLSRTTASSC